MLNATEGWSEQRIAQDGSRMGRTIFQGVVKKGPSEEIMFELTPEETETSRKKKEHFKFPVQQMQKPGEGG